VRRPMAWLRKIALTTHLDGVAWGDDAEVHFFRGGYAVAAPVDGGQLSLNLVVDEAAWRAQRLPRDAAFDAFLARVPELRDRLATGRRVAPIRGVGALAVRTTRQVADGVALVGDAAGYVDPVTGEGIFFALKGAQLLAEELGRALHARRSDAGALAGYVRGRAREVATRCRMAALLQRGLRRDVVVRAAFALLEARPRLADLLVSLVGDYVPMGELWRPSVWAAALAAPVSSAS
jgi:flavin-dependent dehydrogenase